MDYFLDWCLVCGRALPAAARGRTHDPLRGSLYCSLRCQASDFRASPPPRTAHSDGRASPSRVVDDTPHPFLFGCNGIDSNTASLPLRAASTSPFAGSNSTCYASCSSPVREDSPLATRRRPQHVLVNHHHQHHQHLLQNALAHVPNSAYEPIPIGSNIHDSQTIFNAPIQRTNQSSLSHIVTNASANPQRSHTSIHNGASCLVQLPDQTDHPSHVAHAAEPTVHRVPTLADSNRVTIGRFSPPPAVAPTLIVDHHSHTHVPTTTKVLSTTKPRRLVRSPTTTTTTATTTTAATVVSARQVGLLARRAPQSVSSC